MIDRTSYEYKLLVRLYQLLERGKRLKDKEFILTVWPKLLSVTQLYIQYAKDAYLIFSVQNYYARFAEKESNPKYYFSDNGLLNLFLDDKKPSLLENAVAVYLTQNHPEDVYYLKSPKTGIDIDFYIPSARQVVQVAYSIQGDAYEREVGNLKKFAATTTETHRYVIVTYEEEKIINDSDVKIEVVPLMKFLLKC